MKVWLCEDCQEITDVAPQQAKHDCGGVWRPVQSSAHDVLSALSQRAMLRFQRQHWLAESGQLDAASINAIQAVLDARRDRKVYSASAREGRPERPDRQFGLGATLHGSSVPALAATCWHVPDNERGRADLQRSFAMPWSQDWRRVVPLWMLGALRAMVPSQEVLAWTDLYDARARHYRLPSLVAATARADVAALVLRVSSADWMRMTAGSASEAVQQLHQWHDQVRRLTAAPLAVRARLTVRVKTPPTETQRVLWAEFGRLFAAALPELPFAGWGLAPEPQVAKAQIDWAKVAAMPTEAVLPLWVSQFGDEVLAARFRAHTAAMRLTSTGLAGELDRFLQFVQPPAEEPRRLDLRLRVDHGK